MPRTKARCRLGACCTHRCSRRRSSAPGRYFDSRIIPAAMPGARLQTAQEWRAAHVRLRLALCSRIENRTRCLLWRRALGAPWRRQPIWPDGVRAGSPGCAGRGAGGRGRTRRMVERSETHRRRERAAKPILPSRSFSSKEALVHLRQSDANESWSLRSPPPCPNRRRYRNRSRSQSRSRSRSRLFVILRRGCTRASDPARTAPPPAVRPCCRAPGGPSAPAGSAPRRRPSAAPPR